MQKTILMIVAVVLVGCATLKDIGRHLWPTDSTETKVALDSLVIEKEIRRQLEKPTGKLTKADLGKVRELNLEDRNLTEVPKELEKLTQLRELNLSENKLTDVKGLEKLTQLRELQLNHNHLTDVKGLEKLTNLTGLSLYENLYLTKAQIAELEKALPKCSLARNHLPVKIRMALFVEQEPGRGEPVVQLQFFRSQPRTVHVAARPVLELGKGTLEGAVLRESDEVPVFELYLTSQGRLLYQELTSRHKYKRLYVVVTLPDEERKGAMERDCIGVWYVDSTANVRVIRFTPDLEEEEAISVVNYINRTVR
jgi:hypothetical protein